MSCPTISFRVPIDQQGSYLGISQWSAADRIHDKLSPVEPSVVGLLARK